QPEQCIWGSYWLWIPADFIPVLLYLPNSSLDAFKDLYKKFYSFMQKLIKEHYRTFEKGHIQDITDSLIEHCQDKKLDENASVQLSEDKVIAVVFDLFGAGGGSIRRSLCVGTLIKSEQCLNPLEVLVFCRRSDLQELETQLSDRPQLPNLEAFILETFQHSPFLPFTISQSQAVQRAMIMALSQNNSLTPELLLATAIFCIVFYVIKALRTRVPKGLKSPPGPWGWPIIGHMLTLGKNPHLSLTKLSKQYGDVLQIRIGSTPVVVLSGLDTIRQALVRQGDDFKGRPDLYSFTFITDGQSLTFNQDTGPVWVARRRLAMDALKSFSIASDPNSSSSCYLEEHVSKEANHLVSKFQMQMAEAGHFEPVNLVVESVTNVIGTMCFGKNFPRKSEEMLSLLKSSSDFVENVSSGNAVDFFPILRYLPNPALKRFKNFNDKFLLFLQKTVQEHYQDFNKKNIQDITGALFKHTENSKDSGVQIPHKKIVNIVNDLFGAGFETVTTALSWSLLLLVTRPNVQRKIHKELDTVIGKDRQPRLSDRPQLPYLEAFILEIYRYTSFVPFTIPHSTTRDTSLNGFHIPKERCIFINQWQVNHDEKQWEDPFEFRPERFLTEDSTAINKILSEKVMIFGLGKRRCIGETQAKWEVFLFLAILLHQLEFSVPPGLKVDLTPTYGLTMKPPVCKHLQVWPRFSKYFKLEKGTKFHRKAPAPRQATKEEENPALGEQG
ncbi:hypothetical protein U0070_025444, partial [Myodes glareolus]